MKNISPAVFADHKIIKPLAQHQNDDLLRVGLQGDIDIYSGVKGFGYRPNVSLKDNVSPGALWRLGVNIIVQVLAIASVLAILLIAIKSF